MRIMLHNDGLVVLGFVGKPNRIAANLPAFGGILLLF